MQIKREETCINANVATGQARHQSLDTTLSIVASVTVRRLGKHYRAARSADMMLRTSKKNKKELPEGSKEKILHETSITLAGEKVNGYQRKTYSRAEKRKARQI